MFALVSSAQLAHGGVVVTFERCKNTERRTLFRRFNSRPPQSRTGWERRVRRYAHRACLCRVGSVDRLGSVRTHDPDPLMVVFCAGRGGARAACCTVLPTRARSCDRFRSGRNPCGAGIAGSAAGKLWAARSSATNWLRLKQRPERPPFKPPLLVGRSPLRCLRFELTGQPALLPLDSADDARHDHRDSADPPRALTSCPFGPEVWRCCGTRTSRTLPRFGMRKQPRDRSPRRKTRLWAPLRWCLARWLRPVSLRRAD